MILIKSESVVVRFGCEWECGGGVVEVFEGGVVEVYKNERVLSKSCVEQK